MGSCAGAAMRAGEIPPACPLCLGIFALRARDRCSATSTPPRFTLPYRLPAILAQPKIHHPTMISLNQSHKKILAALPLGKAVTLNSASHLSLINLFLDMSNKGSARYPALHGSLNKLAQNGQAASAPVDHANVVDVGADRAGRATARTWISPTGGSVLTGASTLVVDAATNEPLAFGTRTAVGGRLTTASTETATAKPASGQVKAITLYHTIPSADQPARFGLVTAVRNVNLSRLTNDPGFNYIAPVVKIPGHTSIQIAMARSGNAPADCDYIYTADNLMSPNLLVPFVGSYAQGNVLVGYDPVTGLFTPTGGMSMTAMIYAAVSPQGATNKSIANLLTPSAGLYSQVSVVPPTGGPVPVNPTTFYWNWPFVAGATQASNPALQFQPDQDAGSPDSAPLQWVNSAFYFQFTVPTNDPGTPPFTLTVCSDDTPHEASAQCQKIRDLQYWWHCLAAGSLVTLADGSKVPIEKVDNTMRVRTGYGDASLGVEATTAGRHVSTSHTDPRHAAWKIITERGRTLVATAAHPIVTPTGLVIAMDLRPGAAVLSVDGPDRVKSCTRQAVDGNFYNLKVGTETDRRNGIHTEIGTFVASDLLVGDAPALLKRHQATTHNLDYMKGRLPAALHKDYESALVDVARQG